MANLLKVKKPFVVLCLEGENGLHVTSPSNEEPRGALLGQGTGEGRGPGEGRKLTAN